MNRFPIWKYILVAIVVALGFLYTLPNFFGEQPAVQVSAARATVKVDPALAPRVEEILSKANLAHNGVFFDADRNPSVRVRAKDVDTQLRIKEAIATALNPDVDAPTYTVALNQLSSSPAWLHKIYANPMNLGLDLRGGVHFLMQVDMAAALSKRVDVTQGTLRTLLREKNIRHRGIEKSGDALLVRFSSNDEAQRAVGALTDGVPEFAFAAAADGSDFLVRGTIKPDAAKSIQENALKQNITTLNNRINALGVAEPVIQQQGADRIVVQLPGVSDPAEAKRVLGRTATLEVRLVDMENTGLGEQVQERKRDGSVSQVSLKRQVMVTGDQFIDATATFDENQRPAVAVVLDSQGGAVMRQVTRENLKKLMAIVLIEGVGRKETREAISVATIQGEFGNRFQITGQFTPQETNELALLIKAGSLAAPMEIIEERSIGPSLGKENIQQGFNSTLWGFIAIAVFMIIYYHIMGIFSVIALAANVMLLVALLSLVQVTLTLPGIAAIALTLGMAIDANVLINERIREELRAGKKAAEALNEGFERAWATILDSNITTLIAGLALLAFGSGPIRGFAVVHCLGILTSMFSAVVVARAMSNLYYGGRKKLTGISIGQVWKPEDGKTTSKAVATADKA
ncbi:MAG: protein translocase subunit SecD [Burkholderiaceae bacterium]